MFFQFWVGGGIKGILPSTEELIEKLKFDGNCKACEHFDPVEIMSTDLDFEEGVQELAESNELNVESFQQLLLRRELNKMADPNYPLESYSMEKIKKHYLTALFTNCIKHHPIIPQRVLSLRYFK